MRSRRATWGRWLVVFLAAAAIYLCSDRPVCGALVLPVPQSDKLMHAIAYAVFAGVVFRALWAEEALPVPARVLALGVVLAAAYGVTNEFHQRSVPGREFSVFDMLANAVGAMLAAVVWRPLTKRVAWLK